MSTAKETVDRLVVYLHQLTPALTEVASGLDRFSNELEAIDWGEPPEELPVLALSAPTAVQLDRSQPTTVTVDVGLDKPALNDDDGADWTVTGVASSHFLGGKVPTGRVRLRKGDQKVFGGAQFTLAPHVGPFFKNKAQLVTSNPLNVLLAAPADIEVTGGQPSTGKNPSGLPWRSGVTLPANDLDMFDQVDWFEQQRGAKIDVLNIKSNGNKGWKELLDSINQKGPIYAEAARRGIVITQVLDIPDQEPGVIPGIASGNFDGAINQIALALNSYDRLPGYAVRLAHEIPFTPMQGPDKVGVSAFNAAWNHYAALIRARVQGAQIEWNLLRNLGKFTIEGLYPGDQNLDIVSSDPYGNTPLPTDAAFAQYRAKFLDPLVAFARARRKKVAFAEWGTTNTIGPHSALDSAAYIRGMFKFFADNADILNHEVYFHINDKGSVQGDHNHLLFGPDANSPDAAAAYRSLCSGHA
jgi:hypothetical protein